jgi:hypothetical protein
MTTNAAHHAELLGLLALFALALALLGALQLVDRIRARRPRPITFELNTRAGAVVAQCDVELEPWQQDYLRTLWRTPALWEVPSPSPKRDKCLCQPDTALWCYVHHATWPLFAENCIGLEREEQHRP